MQMHLHNGVPGLTEPEIALVMRVHNNLSIFEFRYSRYKVSYNSTFAIRPVEDASYLVYFTIAISKARNRNSA